MIRVFFLTVILCFALLLFSGATALADRIENPVAVFAGLDKITGGIIQFDVYVGEVVQFGALQVAPKVCYSRSQNEPQRLTTFVQVNEITLKRQVKRIFSGWMFAQSPALNAVDHPVYDIWLIDCKQTSDVPPPDQRKNSE